jgi:hypothetical protein
MTSYEFSTFETFQNDNVADITLESQLTNAFVSLDANYSPFISIEEDTPYAKPMTPFFIPKDIPTQNTNPKIPPNPNTFPLHESIRQKLDTFYETQKIPHIIFHGASGTGKITLVQEFIHKIYGGDKHRIKANVMTVNCSHGKGIKFIREELKFFAKTNIQTNSGVLFKTIVLINAHHLTIDAQSALRRCIELFSYNTRFFIVLENKHKLLKPILSRFCEIYVPEYTDYQNNIINLHEHTIQNTYGASSQKQRNQEYIHLRLSPLLRQDTQASIQTFTEMVDEFYYMGISTLDIIDWVNDPFAYENKFSSANPRTLTSTSPAFFTEPKTAYSRIEMSKIMMCFYRIKPEFRCEKMLMFYMLHFMFCSNFELPCL